jgi:hypothetical protein
MLNSRRFGWRQDRGRAIPKKAGLYGQNRNCQGSRLKGQADQEGEGNWDTNRGGMSLKINGMRKCHPHQGFWRSGEVGDFASRDAGKANPRGLSHAVAIRYKDFGPSEPKPVIFRGIYRLQPKSGRFSVNLNGNRASDQGFGRWNPSMLPPIPRLNRPAKSRGPKVRSSGWDACAAQSRGRDASATTMGPAGCLWR